LSVPGGRLTHVNHFFRSTTVTFAGVVDVPQAAF